jgi:cytosine deaminase
MSENLITRNAAVWGQSEPTDLAISGGVYVALDTVDPTSATIIDAQGRLCVPGFIEPHIHLDKVMLADSIPVNVSGSLDEAIEILGARKESYSREDISARAGHIIRAAISNGVTRMRTHIDIDTGCGLTAFEALLDVREQFANLIELHIVAFPQKGIVGDPGCEALLREAMDRGADQIGGMPFNEAGPDESRAHIEIAFDIAREHDCAVDMHIDETDDPNARTLEMLCAATITHGWQGRVIAGHTCALAAYPDDYAERVMDMVAEAGIHMITNPATNLMLQGREDSHPKRRGITRVKELLSRGVNVAFGQDNLRDMFYPFGRDDPLELAFLLAHAAHMSQPDEIETLFTMTTDNAAQVLGLTDYGTTPGCAGDLVILDAQTPLQAIVEKPDRRYVIRRGRVVAETETRRTIVAE